MFHLHSAPAPLPSGLGLARQQSQPSAGLRDSAKEQGAKHIKRRSSQIGNPAGFHLCFGKIIFLV
jgi:hypothetical protein